ncbi:MAG: GNAT family N-acetyltransferase [Chloroflexota bacterium]|nr:GNAT family N-acetyltransferase [Chloroflexota bacterium]
MSVTGIFASKPTIEGGRATLRPFTPADIQAMGSILADPEMLRFTGSVHTTAEARSRSPRLDEATRRWYETRADQAGRLDLAVVDRVTNMCVGEVVLNDVNEPNDACNFRILIGPHGRDRGIGSEATRMVLDHAFRTTCLNRIELDAYVFNPRALHVYEQCGFVYEGRRRAALKFDAEYVDAIVMSMLRSDWEQGISRQ